jgi:hypothetical protein
LVDVGKSLFEYTDETRHNDYLIISDSPYKSEVAVVHHIEKSLMAVAG